MAGGDRRAAGACLGHAGRRDRRVKDAVGALSVGMGAATALAVHRVVDGSTVALDISLPVILALVIGSLSDGPALATLLQEPGQRLAPWAVMACASPALGVAVTSLSPISAPLFRWPCPQWPG
ncbi:hypothetical protein ACH4SK_34230 [Streptomyces inhibens]|uniref:hypothetical protein n=1 Tax=Streptomyces inhibens TaxID=2293571 RepID=UPI0037AB8807